MFQSLDKNLLSAIEEKEEVEVPDEYYYEEDPYYDDDIPVVL